MSLIWLQVGQCGNQIGQEWWQIITSSGDDADRYPYFSRDGLINAICVDSEPKVVRRLRQQVRKGYFRDANIISGQRGRGNNWAYGLGSRLCEEIRDHYPAGHLLSVTAAPHESGETPLQHYNALLCLSWLQRYCDGVLLFPNDEVLKRAASTTDKKSYTSSGLQPAVSLPAMNAHIASCLAGLLYPVYSLKTKSTISIGLEPWELIRCLCPMASMKYLHAVQACRRGTAFWDKVTSSVVQTVPRANPQGRLHHSLSVLAVTRSSQDYSFLLSRDSVLTKLKHSYRCVSWNPFPVHCWTDPQNILDPSNHSHSLTVCANHSSAADLITSVLGRARTMYDARAYLHWYRRYGCEDGDFHEAFNTLDSVVEEYTNLGQQ
ncbi:tubulin delta chain-like isoform X2 [Hyperolius riggenbachi]|uniref:tubulin delta chain-like isoform X2 n=1 Tax=Hyperolius riggenbachi TaxID=752182 RepID=UPI0035A2C823